MLIRVSCSKPCNMPVGNLAKIFVFTLMGAVEDQDVAVVRSLIADQILVLQYLLNMPLEFYSTMLQHSINPPNQLYQTASTDSLIRPITNMINFTPKRYMWNVKKRCFELI